ncbi:MAG: hypothetical protein WDW38_001567 [Sanguina aurantia]
MGVQLLLVRLATDIARGLAFLHSFSLCHGDLKLDNVLLSISAPQPSLEEGSSTSSRNVTGRPPYSFTGGPRIILDSAAGEKLYPNMVAKLSDFGLTRAMTASHLSTGTVGTITHVSPEQLIHGRLGPESDIYALGMIIWELAEGGAVPHKGLSHAEIVYHVAHSDLRPKFSPTVPQPLVDIACACWVTDPVLRPTSAAVLKSLESLSEQGPHREGRAPTSSVADKAVTAKAPVTSPAHINVTPDNSPQQLR